jgi:hypothetical protein
LPWSAVPAEARDAEDARDLGGARHRIPGQRHNPASRIEAARDPSWSGWPGLVTSEARPAGTMLGRPLPRDNNTIFKHSWAASVMAKRWSKKAAFAHFGAQGRNERWSWSARSADGAVVVLTLWRDEFDYSTSPATYSSFGREAERRANKAGNNERRENLIWARDHCGGIFRGVIAVAVDVAADPRKILRCAPSDLNFRLLELDEGSGEFRAEVVDPLGRVSRTSGGLGGVRVRG